VAQKKAEAAANKLKSHEHDANAALAHGTSYSVHGVRNAKQNGGRSKAEHETMPLPEGKVEDVHVGGQAREKAGISVSLWQAVARAENETEQLKDIELALQRIADQSYGLCINCGERIHDKRLEAAPLALRCLPCQTAFEKQPVTI
jgi:hypothetical protein